MYVIYLENHQKVDNWKPDHARVLLIVDLETTVDETNLVLGLQDEVIQLLERLTVLETAVASMSVSTQGK